MAVIYADENTPINMYFARFYYLDGRPMTDNPYIKSDDSYQNATLAIEHMLESPVMRDRLIAARCPLTAYEILHNELSQEQRAGFLEALGMLWDEVYHRK